MQLSALQKTCFPLPLCILCLLGACDRHEREVPAARDVVSHASPVDRIPSRPWLPGPSWYDDLSPDARKDLQHAETEHRVAVEACGNGKLAEAEKLLRSVRGRHHKLLGDDRWLTWQDEWELARLGCEPEWDKVTEPPVDMVMVWPALRDIAYNEDNANVATDQVTEICQRLAKVLPAEYSQIADYYRELALGLFRYRKGQLDDARRHFEAAVELTLQIFPMGHPYRVYTRNYLCKTLLQDEPALDLDTLSTHCSAALDTLYAGLPSEVYPDFWLETLQIAARCAYSAGRHSEVRMALQAALEIHEAAGTARGREGLLTDLTAAYNLVHDHATALSLLEPIEAGAASAEVLGQMYTERGTAHAGLGQRVKAFDDYQEALRILGCDAERSEACARAHYFFAIELSMAHEFEQADGHFDLAYELQPSDRLRQLIRLLQFRSRLSQAMHEPGREDVSRVTYLRDEIAKLDLHTNVGKSRQERLLAYANAWLGNWRAARDACSGAIASYEEARSVLGVPAPKRAIWHEYESPYLLAAIAEKAHANGNAAFEHLERHAAQGLRHWLAGESTPVAADSLWHRIRLLDSDRRATKSGAYRGAIAARLPRRVPTDPGAPSEPQDLRISDLLEGPLLDEQTAIVGWLDDAPPAGLPALEASWGFVITKQGKCQWEKLEPVIGLRELIEDVLELAGTKDAAIDGHAEWRSPAHQLFKNRFGPLWHHLDSPDLERIYVLNRGLMLDVPVEMLPIEAPKGKGTPALLGDRFSVAYGPSCSVLENLVRRPKVDPREGKLLAIEDTERLTFSAAEVRAVAAGFTNSLVLPASRGTEARIYEQDAAGLLSAYSFVLFSTHAQSHPYMLDRCLLELERGARLAASATGDGALDFWEISTLTLPASLIVLTGCETARGRRLESEGYLGLPHAFFATGARAVITSLWRVPDFVSTAILMEQLFDNMVKRHMAPGPALKDAKQHLRRQSWNAVVKWCEGHGIADQCRRYPRSDDLAFEHPYFWAGFILVGPQN